MREDCGTALAKYTIISHFHNNFTHYNKINTLALSAELLVEGPSSSCETPMEVDGAVWLPSPVILKSNITLNYD